MTGLSPKEIFSDGLHDKPVCWLLFLEEDQHCLIVFCSLAKPLFTATAQYLQITMCLWGLLGNTRNITHVDASHSLSLCTAGPTCFAHAVFGVTVRYLSTIASDTYHLTYMLSLQLITHCCCSSFLQGSKSSEMLSVERQTIRTAHDCSKYWTALHTHGISSKTNSSWILL